LFAYLFVKIIQKYLILKLALN